MILFPPPPISRWRSVYRIENAIPVSHEEALFAWRPACVDLLVIVDDQWNPRENILCRRKIF